MTEWNVIAGEAGNLFSLYALLGEAGNLLVASIETDSRSEFGNEVEKIPATASQE